MRSGLSGFRLFIACLALGVAAIAGILSFSRAVEEGLHADAREILGGDVAISLLYRAGDARAGRRSCDRCGQLVRWIDSRAMARPIKPDGRATLVQLKAVEPAYPLYGTVELQGGGAAGRCAGQARRHLGRGGRGGGAQAHEPRARRPRARGRRHGRGARHHRPRARPRAERLRKPRPAPDDPVRGAWPSRASCSRAACSTGSTACACRPGASDVATIDALKQPLSRRRLAAARAGPGRRRHPLLARSADRSSSA